jgi:hypothetical protein
MSRRSPLIPEPKGIDDAVKASAGAAERKWEAVAIALGAGAGLTGGTGLVPAAAVFGAAASMSLFLRARAKWLKEDPPRPDYRNDVVLAHSRINVAAFGDVEVPPAGRQLVLSLEAAALHTGALIEALEKFLGAELDARRGRERAVRFAHVRFAEAIAYAESTSHVLKRAVADADQLADEVTEWLPPAAEARVPASLDDLPSEVVGQLLVGGVPGPLLRESLHGDVVSVESIPVSLTMASETTRGLVHVLGHWISNYRFSE